MNIDLPVSLLPPARENEICTSSYLWYSDISAFVAYLFKTKERGAREDESFQNYQIVPSSVFELSSLLIFKVVAKQGFFIL
jgi:hypothetical protein